MEKYEFSKNIESNFCGKNLSSHWWMLSIWEFLISKLNIKALLNKLIRQNYNPKKVKFTQKDVVFQKIIAIIAWYTTDNAEQYFKNDLVFKELLWKIIPKTTVNRITNTFLGTIENALQKAMQEIELYNLSVSKTKSVIIDIDTSFDSASQNIWWVKFNQHYSTFCFSPIFAINSLTWDIIKWDLRPWNWACSKGVVEFIRSIVEMYKKKKIDTIMRFDSGFWKPELYEYLEENKVKYTIKLKKNNSLVKKAKEILDKLNLKPWTNKIVEFEYMASSWDKKRRVICSIDWINKEIDKSKKDKMNKNWAKQTSLESNFSFIVTNSKILKVEEVLSLYNWRATVETVIEEAKNGFWINKLSHKRFEVNKSVFQIHLLAMQTLQLYRKFSIWVEKTAIEMTKTYSKKEYNNKFNWIFKIGRKLFNLPTIQTIRKTILEIPTSIVKWQRKIYFQFEITFWWRKIYQKVMNKIRKLPKLIFST